MATTTPHQEALGRSLSAALLISEAKVKEHEAACLLGEGEVVERARVAAIAAAEAVLDARERLVRSFCPPTGRDRRPT